MKIYRGARKTETLRGKVDGWFTDSVEAAEIYGEWIHEYTVKSPVRITDMSNPRVHKAMSDCYGEYVRFERDHGKNIPPMAFELAFVLDKENGIIRRASSFEADSHVLNMYKWAHKGHCSKSLQETQGWGAYQMPMDTEEDFHHAEFVILHPSRFLVKTGGQATKRDPEKARRNMIALRDARRRAEAKKRPRTFGSPVSLGGLDFGYPSPRGGLDFGTPKTPAGKRRRAALGTPQGLDF